MIKTFHQMWFHDEKHALSVTVLQRKKSSFLGAAVRARELEVKL